MLTFLGTCYFLALKPSASPALSSIKIINSNFSEVGDTLRYWIHDYKDWDKVSQFAVTLHFLTFLAFPQHGVSQLSQNRCFHFIMDNQGFLRRMHIYVTSFNLPVRKGKKWIKWKAQKTHQSRNQLPASCFMQTLNPSSALLLSRVPSHLYQSLVLVAYSWPLPVVHKHSSHWSNLPEIRKEIKVVLFHITTMSRKMISPSRWISQLILHYLGSIDKFLSNGLHLIQSSTNGIFFVILLANS